MKKFLPLIERISMVIVVILPVLAIPYFIYLRWGSFHNDFPLPVYIKISNILTPSIAVCVFIFWLALFMLRLSVTETKGITSRDVILLVGTLIGIPMCFVFSILALSPEILSSSAQLGTNHYYVIIQHAIGDHNFGHGLYKCNEKDFECKMIYQEVVSSAIYPTQLIVDQHAHEIHFFLGRWLEYTDGPYPHKYHPINTGKIDATYYYLDTHERNSAHEFVISKCDGEYLDNQLSCSILPFHYSTTKFDNAELVIDKQAKEAKLLIDDRLIFSYDTAPHCHIEGCAITEQ